jgi:hypothetical protein
LKAKAGAVVRPSRRGDLNALSTLLKMVEKEVNDFLAIAWPMENKNFVTTRQ